MYGLHSPTNEFNEHGYGTNENISLTDDFAALVLKKVGAVNIKHNHI